MRRIPRVLVIATSRKTRGGITAVVKAHETGGQWKKYHCRWIQTHRDGPTWRKLWYLVTALIEYVVLLPWYDVVHIHVGVFASVTRKMIFAMLAKSFHKKLIVHFHPASEEHLTNLAWVNRFKKLFDLSDLLIVLSPHWMNVIHETYPDRKYRMTFLYNPCPIVKRDFSKRENVVLFAGTLIDRKGYHRLLQAFAKIADKYPTWRIEFAGNGEIDKARQLQKKLGIPKQQVRYLGWVSGEEKNKAFQRASIYCLPSRGEGFPMGVLDALAYGVPVITTPVGGIMDAMTDGVDGLIYDIYDIDKLAKCLDKMMGSQSCRMEIQTAADKLVNGVFSVRVVCQKLDDIYKSLF